MNEKPTNPKDACGVKKIPASVVPQSVMAEVALGMFEGARKYGRHNYRAIGVRSSIYYDATRRHIDSWWEGEDDDPDTGLNHITKAITSLVVLRDAMIQDMLTDDRPPEANPEHKDYLDQRLAELFERHPESKEAFVRERSEPLNLDPWEGLLEIDEQTERIIKAFEDELDPWTEFDDRQEPAPRLEETADLEQGNVTLRGVLDRLKRVENGLAQSQGEFFKR